MRELVKHLADPAGLVRGAPAPVRARLEVATRDRAWRVVTELETEHRESAGAAVRGGAASLY